MHPQILSNPTQLLLWKLLDSRGSDLAGYANLLILMCVGILPACMLVRPAHTVLGETRREIPRTGDTDSGECWESNSRALEERPGLLTTEPFLRPLVVESGDPLLNIKGKNARSESTKCSS